MGLSSSHPVASPSTAKVRMGIPDAPWVSVVDVEHAFRLQLSCDLFLNFAATDLDYKFPVKEVPLKGEWDIRICREKGEVRIYVNHGDGMPVGFFSMSVVGTLSFCWISSDGQQRPIYRSDYRGSDFPGNVGGEPATGCHFPIKGDMWTKAARLSGGTFVPATHRSYRLTVSFGQAVPDIGAKVPAAVAVKEAGNRERAKRLTDLHFQQTPHDVCLRFPRGQGAHELWTNSDLLSRASPYFVDLFSSEFAEAKVRTGDSAAEDDDDQCLYAEKDFDDSDDETDEVLFSKRPHLLKRSPRAANFPLRQITITQTAFSTYHAILVYLQTGFIHFASLNSSSPPSGPASRTTLLVKTLDEDPSLPSPVSPKSTYRLAHLLQLEDLQKLSLDAFRTSLSPSNAADELFSDASLAYDDLRAVIVEVIKADWPKARDSQVWKDKHRAVRAKEASLEEAAAVTEVLTAVAMD